MPESEAIQARGYQAASTLILQSRSPFAERLGLLQLEHGTA